MRLIRYFLLAGIAFLFTTTTYAQKKKKKEKQEDVKIDKAVDAVATAVKEKLKDDRKKGPKAFKDLIDTSAVSQKGMISVHKMDDKWYFEIPDSLLDKDIMAVTRYAKTAAGGGIFGGEEVNRQMIRWEKGMDHNLLLRSVTVVVASPDSTKPIFQAVKNSNSDPIIGVFEIKAVRKEPDAKSSVIDVTDFFNADNQVFSLSSVSKQLLKLSSFKKEASYIEKIRSFPINTEIRTVKTFSVTPQLLSTSPTPSIGQYLPSGLDAGVVTMEMNTSLILLPEKPMRKRIFDSRVGYFANQYAIFGEESQRSDTEVFAVRWRLEPKHAEDAKRQQNGELIEPKKPIVYYIDPATPEKWRKYLKAGVDDWQEAFEKAGWKNAIRGEYWPENDTTMSLEDARYSVIRYFAADIQNAYGPNVHDPRSGEILESHIGWYHNVMRLLRNWYIIQAGAVDPKARAKKFDDELMGQLVRFVSSHEIGHTLGLRHNMGASSATPVEKLRDKEWIEKHGHTASIMDYARFNYVAQPEDSITNLFPRIGDYDKWAIQWGYSNFIDAKDVKAEKQLLNAMTKEAYKDSRLHFGTEISPYDPRYQTEDLSDNAMKASEYGIKNLKRILPNLIEWSREDGESYKELDEIYSNVIQQYRRYLGHVMKNVGGIYDNPTTYDMEGSTFETVPKTTQKEAVAFLNNQLFKTPTWLLDQNILNKIKPETGVEAIKALQEYALTTLFAGDRAVRLMETGISGKNYTLDDLFTDLESGIWSETKTGKSIDLHRRNLQKVYIEKLVDLLKPGKANVLSVPVGVTYGFSTRVVELEKTDLPSVARAHLENLKTALQPAIAKSTDKITKYHLQDVLQRIKMALDPK
ncbi:zinc-dependent metalloprotease [Dyadobacter chenwenxiniae]|uniref:Zinc-dependent metalloprotease n=1 Tax=Dyadobacter chenwenxiniae TaxID=2906456 RepID=A0A9X1TEJ5_9BACT|nr:zinc-dependent metalloprotease [Dyadobacter chenwenxiniae]MCF0062097.1 zinc-dependent metalloprotease [Dyadobacter chenwenxiniae]UON81902.1 zinc-dependent metalloprotease [Dyadobacter chenwenxiniae]